MAFEELVQGRRAAPAPLVLDLDGTLVRSDLLIESAFACLGRDPVRIVSLIRSAFEGKAALKAAIAAQTPIDVAHLPYNQRVLELVHKARREGREVHVASASHERYVAAVAEHIGADGWFASGAVENLAGDAKARRLVDAFGRGAFDYVGDSRADLAVWEVARKGYAVQPSEFVRKRLAATAGDVEIIESEGSSARSWIKLARVHQWAKNALVFVPMLTAQKFDVASFLEASGAFVAFSLTASSVYILNDLVDLEADRKHPSKRWRPLASGALPIQRAAPASLLFLAAGFGVALSVSRYLALTLLVYFALTTAYTFFLKRKMIVDIIALAALYTIRVIGGAAAISVDVSEWLLAFSMFIFTSLALIKRYVEMAARADADLPNPSNRNYQKSDLDILAALAAASGFNAVTVFALYASSDFVQHAYRHPRLLWLVCPVLMYWLSRALMLAHRRLMDDDPILFALKDRNSLLAFGLIAALMAGAVF